MRMENDSHNHTPCLKDKQGRTPIQTFGSTDVYSNPKHWHHFACPAYTLKHELQHAGGIFHKWKPRSKVGVYLGRSPSHFRSVALILDIDMGLVSPQFHIKLDPLFQTVKGDTQQESHKSLWQIKSGFVLQKDIHTVNKKRARPTSKFVLSDPPDDIDELVRMPEIVQHPDE
jgi:hypothetical protein